MKMTVVIAAVGVAAGLLCGCSALPSSLQSKNAYGAADRATLAVSPGTVTSPNGRVIGADPDTNVRFEMARDYSHIDSN